METRILGPLASSAMGLGCMGMTLSYGAVDRTEAKATLEAALDSGVTHFDTAQFYGSGRNESFIGPVLRRRRDDLLIATKTGVRSVRGFPVGFDGRPESIRRAITGSLARLGIEHVDIYYLHRVDPKVPVEESIGAIGELVDAGLVRQVGISEPSVGQLRRAHAAYPVAALQIEWSLFSRDHEQALIPAARELGIGIVAFSPLGRGMLTGDAAATTKLPLVDYRRLLPRWRKKHLQANLDAVDAVRVVAQRHDATPGQVALAWVLARGGDVVAIPGTKRRRWLKENLAAADLTLTQTDMEALDLIRASGSRVASPDLLPRED